MRTLAAFAALFLFAACQAPPTDEMTEADYDQIVTSVMDRTDEMMAAWNAYDLDAAMSFFDPDKTSFAWGSTIYDFNSLKQHWGEIWAAGDRQEVSWTGRNIEVLSESAVLFQGSFELTFFYSDGRVGHWPGTAHWTVLMELHNGNWQITYGGYSYGSAQTTQ